MEKTGMEKFSKAVKGYDVAEVDEFVSKLSNIFGSADLEDLRGLLRSGRKCFFAYSESEIAEGSVRSGPSMRCFACWMSGH